MGKDQEIQASGKTRALNVLADPPDIRDRMYQPALVELKPSLEKIQPGPVLDQGNVG